MTAGIRQEYQQRTKILNAEAEVAARAAAVAEAEQAKRVKENQDRAKLILLRREEEERIAIVCGAAELEPSEDNVAKCEMKHFAMLRAPQARKWIAARSNLKTKEINDSKKPRTAL